MSPLFEELERQLRELEEAATEELGKADQPVALEAIRAKFLGRRGKFQEYFSHLGSLELSSEERARLGKRLNGLKEQLQKAVSEKRKALSPEIPLGPSPEDLTLPGILPEVGRLHPVTQTIQEIVSIFHSLGFAVVEGPEIETEYYNFEALNIPKEHPSRESFDTFYLTSQEPGAKERLLLRSHTSPVQIRFMQAHRPPFQIVVPGRVFRPDAVDASHSFQFHQVEGLAVGPGITFGDLKGVLTAWAKEMFSKEARLRFRPHYFPFTEPSAEVDLACIFCQGKGCRVCGQKGWLEILGCGMVHPNVFRAVGYLPGTVGYAFGLGVERIAMLKYGIDDIRLFAENDLRFLIQFG